MKTRRDFLRFSALTLGSGLTLWMPTKAGSTTAPGGTSVGIEPCQVNDPDWTGCPPRDKLLIFFQRGGCDGTNVAAPSADNTYTTQRIGFGYDITIDPNDGLIKLQDWLPSGRITECHAHPGLDALKPIWDAQQMAVIQRVGYRNSSRSHFKGQDIWETADPAVGPDGFVARYLNIVATEANAFPGGAFTSGPVKMLDVANRSFPQINDLYEYNYSNDDILGALPDNNDPDGSGLLGVYDAAASSLVRRDGLTLLNSMKIVEQELIQNPLSNLIGNYTGDVGRNCRDAIWSLLHTNCTVAVVNQGGYDTHGNQGGITGSQFNRLDEMSNALKAVYDDAVNNNFWDKLVILVVTEFGRTDINTSGGTDHGKASVSLVMGGNVNGNAYNCDDQTYWKDPASQLSPLESDGAMDYRTDFRTIYAEIFNKHLGMRIANLDTIIPGWSTLTPDAAHPNEFDILGLL